MARIRGERYRVPIRDLERESKAATPSEVKVYKLPPEEIERIFAGARKPEAEPFNTRPDGGRYERMPEKKPVGLEGNYSSEKQRERALKRYAGRD